MQAKIRSGDILLIPSVLSYTKLKPTAEDPFKDELNQVGYEITIIERSNNRTEDITNDVNEFATGIVMNAPKHYHLEIIEHPSLYKTGYSLVGAPRIINPGNAEELVLPLMKFKDAEDLELPFRAALVVVRQTEYCSLHAIGVSANKNEYDGNYDGNRSTRPSNNQRGTQNTRGSTTTSGRGKSKSGRGGSNTRSSNMF